MADEIKIEVDVNAIRDMPLETLDLLDRAGEGTLKGGQLLDLLDGFVVGGVRGRGFKVRDLEAISRAVSEAMKAQSSGGVTAAA